MKLSGTNVGIALVAAGIAVGHSIAVGLAFVGVSMIIKSIVNWVMESEK